METIIGLLFILLPVIFKLIGKKFEQSGDSGKARKIREFVEVLEGEDSPMPELEDFGNETFGQPEEEQMPVPKSEGIQSIITSKPVLLEDEPKKEKKEKIDPKKLVLYSEIMKTKF